MNMARQGVDLKGVASFHGSLNAIKPAQIGNVKAKILVLHGGDDKFIPTEQIEAFKRGDEICRRRLPVLLLSRCIA